MAKRYELSIKASYLPNWDTYSAVREIVQNAKDAEVQDNAPMRFEHIYRQRGKEKVGCLIIENKGTTIPIQALLIGHTTKLNDSRTRGLYGEGLKLGILVLLRLGLEVKIRNGDEVWNPVIAYSRQYGADVLAFDITSGHKFKNRVSIEIVGIELNQWEEIKKKFLFLNSEPVFSVKIPSGEILLHPDYIGNIYVKGMFVGSKSDLKFGYNFNDADIDRDRRMLSDLYEKTSTLLSEAMNKGELTEGIFELLSTNSHEARYIYHYNVNEEAKKNLAHVFNKKYDGAIPADSHEQVNELSHFGIKGVEVNYTLRNLLDSSMSNASNKIAELRFSSKKQYSLHELEEKERNNVLRSIDLVSKAQHKLGMTPITEDKLSIVDFGDPNLRGTFDPTDNQVRLARRITKKLSTTLRVLIHEVAHIQGVDGHKNHESGIGNLTETIFDIIL